MDKIALELGPLQIRWYSICIFTGILVACILIYKEAKKNKIDEEFLINLTFYTILIGILGARLYYIIFNLSYYLSNPIEIIKIWNGGLAIHGGIIAGLLFIIYYCKKYKVDIYKILDMVVVGLIVAQAIGRWGNFFNQEAYGPITTKENLTSLFLPNFIIEGMYISGAYHYPTFFYESTWCLIGFIIMLLLRKYKKLKPGYLTGFYLIWYGIIRFMIEAMRTDALMLGPIKVAQLVSIIFVISGLTLIIIKSLKNKNVVHKLGGKNE